VRGHPSKIVFQRVQTEALSKKRNSPEFTQRFVKLGPTEVKKRQKRVVFFTNREEGIHFYTNSKYIYIGFQVGFIKVQLQ